MSNLEFQPQPDDRPTPDARLLRDLASLHASPAETSASLGRVWHRLAQKTSAQSIDMADSHPITLKQQGERPVANESTSPTTVRPLPATHRAPNWLAPMVALVLVVLGALIFSVIPRHSSSGVGTAQKTVTNVPTRVGPGTWNLVPTLGISPTFLGSATSAIAPSDPHVVYEVLLQKVSTINLRRTDNDGQTWHTLPFPIPGKHISGANLFVNPRNALQIHIAIYDTIGADCPAGYLQIGNNQSDWPNWCWLQYSSDNGGQTWTFERLPLHGVFDQHSVNNFQPIRSQGNQLYVTLMCGDFSCTRLITSSDGGHTWILVDGAIAAAHQTLCDDAVPSVGTTIYILSSTTCLPQDQGVFTLWVSSDGGTHWTHHSPLPTPNEWGMAAAGNLLYAELPVTTLNHIDKTGSGNYVITSYRPQDLQVTADGGATWQHAPTTGVPTQLQLLRVLGMLQDGSVVGEFVKNADGNYDFDNASLYTWQLGESAWQPLGNSTTGNIEQLIVAPSTTHPLGDLWLAQTGGENFHFTFLHYQP